MTNLQSAIRVGARRVVRDGLIGGMVVLLLLGAFGARAAEPERMDWLTGRIDGYIKHIYIKYMKTISLNVSEPAYEALKAAAEQDGRPVSELIRQSMAEFIDRRRASAPSALTLQPHDSGPLIEDWSRSDLIDEMRSS